MAHAGEGLTKEQAQTRDNSAEEKPVSTEGGYVLLAKAKGRRSCSWSVKDSGWPWQWAVAS